MLSNQDNYKLLIELEDWSDKKVYAEYSSFRLEPESEFYRLRLGTYQGNAGDSLMWHNGKQFTTLDRDKDVYAGESEKPTCALCRTPPPRHAAEGLCSNTLLSIFPDKHLPRKPFSTQPKGTQSAERHSFGTQDCKATLFSLFHLTAHTHTHTKTAAHQKCAFFQSDQK